MYSILSTLFFFFLRKKNNYSKCMEPKINYKYNVRYYIVNIILDTLLEFNHSKCKPILQI